MFIGVSQQLSFKSPSLAEFLKSYEYLTQTLIDRAEHCEDRDMENNRALENDEALCKY